ncbi:putative metalloprotease CJM1_0395 family protein [Pseudoalteromonas aurantia]|uniref:Catalase n=1 Tax=Pseudoalteromonas aurantia 208 TaxID=1314867 RepID=A0ABR9E6I5_9GAMM|nr:putative metalloprotease CJM1_0395 family protein [Pseudoalteromonas aurantia]MBE0366598.1 hypothetical protein [Pseudoalteromonas aurantia 208]
MSIVTPPPAMNLNTANVYTETARRDNQLREVIPKAAPTSATFTENKAVNDGDKAKANSPDDNTLYDSSGKLEKNKVIDEKGAQSDDRQAKSDGDDTASEQEQNEEKAEQQQIQELKSRDTEVRLHEQAHARVGGQYAGSPSYEYQRGPDGNNYAVGGQVMIDVAEIPGDPSGTIEKMQTVRAAALAPAEPSGADRAIAADATQKQAAAQAELAKQVISRGAEEENQQQDTTRVQNYETRRLAADDEGLALSDSAVLESESGPFSVALPIEPEAVALKSEGGPFSVALPIERDPQIQARSLRINDFYQQSVQPELSASLSLQV